VERRVVVEFFAHQHLDALDMFGGEVGAQLNRDLAVLELEQQGVFWVCHKKSPKNVLF